MKRLAHILCLAALLLPTLSPAAELTELGEETGAAVLDLVPFDGRLYLRRAVAAEAEKFEIAAYEPGEIEPTVEHRAAGGHVGRFRVIDGKLYVPGSGGYWVSPGKGKWRRAAAVGEDATFNDVARFDGRLFLAGSQGDKAIIAWRRDGEEKWQVEHLTEQAARFSPTATGFLGNGKHLTVLAVRDVTVHLDGLRIAVQEWGGWYVLHYFPKASVRGFLFDGQPRPLPVLRALAPNSEMIQNFEFAVASEQRWGDELLYVALHRQGITRDASGGLFRAELRQGNPQVGRTFFARRIDGMELARDIQVTGKRCTVLLAENAATRAVVKASADLKTWQTVFDGDLPSAAVAIATLGESCYLGLVSGVIVRIDAK